MKRYITNPVTVPPQEPHEAASSFDLLKALEQCEIVLGREIKNLMVESSSKKLNSASSKDLVAYIKLLHEIKADKLKELGDKTDEELEELVKGQS